MWGYLLVVLGVLAMFNLVAILARLWLHTAEEIAFAFIGCLLLCGVAFGIERLPPSPGTEASAATFAPSYTAPTPATTPAVVPSAPIAATPSSRQETPHAPPPPEVTPPPKSPEPPKPPSDPRWQYPRYSIGEPEKPPATAKDQHTVIIEPRDPRWKYSRYAAPADQIKTPSGKPAALFVFHAKSGEWTIPFYPSDVRYRYEATGNVLVRVNGTETISDLTAINQPDAAIQSLSFKAKGVEPVTIYVYPTQP